MKRGWFGPKWIGWGASPSSWQGWLLTALLVAVEVGLGRYPGLSETGAWLLRGLALFVFLAIVAVTYRDPKRG